MITVIRAFMTIIGIVGVYALFTSGDPNSLFRSIISDPVDDIYLVTISSIIFFILGFFLFYSRDRADFRKIVELNADKINTLRAQGKKDQEIANSILNAMGSYKGYKHNMALKKLALNLSEFKS